MEIFDNLTAPVALSLDVLDPNTGQMQDQGLPENPKVIRDEKFEFLKQSITEHPKFLRQNSLIVYPYLDNRYIIIGGNQRYAALTELGYTHVPCHILPKETPISELKAIVIIDNTTYGQWDWQKLQQEDWNVEELNSWGVDLPYNWQKVETSFTDVTSVNDGVDASRVINKANSEPQYNLPTSPSNITPMNNLPDELLDVDIQPEELPKIVGEDKVAMERIIIVYPKNRVEEIEKLIGLPKITKVVYNIDEIINAGE